MNYEGTYFSIPDDLKFEVRYRDFRSALLRTRCATVAVQLLLTHDRLTVATEGDLVNCRCEVDLHCPSTVKPGHILCLATRADTLMQLLQDSAGETVRFSLPESIDAEKFGLNRSAYLKIEGGTCTIFQRVVLFENLSSTPALKFQTNADAEAICQSLQFVIPFEASGRAAQSNDGVIAVEDSEIRTLAHPWYVSVKNKRLPSIEFQIPQGGAAELIRPLKGGFGDCRIARDHERLYFVSDDACCSVMATDSSSHRIDVLEADGPEVTVFLTAADFRSAVYRLSAQVDRDGKMTVEAISKSGIEITTDCVDGNARILCGSVENDSESTVAMTRKLVAASALKKIAGNCMPNATIRITFLPNVIVFRQEDQDISLSVALAAAAGS